MAGFGAIQTVQAQVRCVGSWPLDQPLQTITRAPLARSLEGSPLVDVGLTRRVPICLPAIRSAASSSLRSRATELVEPILPALCPVSSCGPRGQEISVTA
jgi:hypothetical protein